MKAFYIILLFLFHLASFAQVRIQDNIKTARTIFGVQKIQAVINQLKLNTKKHEVVIDKKLNGKKESFSIETK